MELAVNQVANFRPPITTAKQEKGLEVVLGTAKISPSDLPNQVEISKKNSFLSYGFEYSVMEPENNLKDIKSNNYSFKYSEITGRLYFLEFQISNFASLSKNIKEVFKALNKKRLKDNLKFGLDLSQEIFKLILGYEE